MNGTQAAAPPAGPPVAKAAAPAAPAAAGPATAPPGQHAAPGRPDSQTQAGAGGVTKQSASAKAGKDDEEWWTE